MPSICMETPTGALVLTEADGALVRVSWGPLPTGQTDHHPATPLLTEAAAQLSAYFSGTLTRFDLPLNVTGGALQRAVCARMLAIPYGETITYGDIAAEMDRPAQAIGQACGGNPIPVIIPCHRVLSARGLGGFSGAGGIETKIALLRLEGAASLLI